MTDEPKKGFEHEGDFYEWSASDGMKDMLLLDRISGGMAPHEFFTIIEGDEVNQILRSPILYSLAAMSIRHARPEMSLDWIVEACSSLEYSVLVQALVDSHKADAEEQEVPLRSGADETPNVAADKESKDGESEQPSARSKASPAGRSAKS